MTNAIMVVGTIQLRQLNGKQFDAAMSVLPGLMFRITDNVSDVRYIEITESGWGDVFDPEFTVCFDEPGKRFEPVCAGDSRQPDYEGTFESDLADIVQHLQDTDAKLFPTTIISSTSAEVTHKEREN